MLTFFVMFKGGAGKSTGVCNLAPLVQLRTPGGSVGVVDRDPNGTTRNFMLYRSEQPSKTPIDFLHEPGDSPEAYQAILDFMAEHEHVLFDMPGQRDEKSRALLYYLMDTTERQVRFVIPMKPSQADIDQVADTYALVQACTARREKAGLSPIRVCILINEAPHQTETEVKGSIEAIKGHGLTPVRQHLHTRKAYRDSMATGISVLEMSNRQAGKAAAEIRAIYSDIFGVTKERQAIDKRKTKTKKPTTSEASASW